jgi:hypothetical protein
VSYSFDVFVAVMKCFNCNRVSLADESTNMQTYLRDKPQLENLGIGMFVGEHRDEADGYLKISNPNETVTLLDTWDCSYCNHRNWAKITIEKGLITDIMAVKLDRSSYNESNYISQGVSSDAMYLSGNDYATVKNNGVLETLEEYLK